jgi:hypothetical protein
MKRVGKRMLRRVGGPSIRPRKPVSRLGPDGTYALSGFTTATEGSSMQRRWQVQPNGTGVLSREQLIEALIDGAAILDIAGGVLTCVVGRAPTNLPG